MMDEYVKTYADASGTSFQATIEASFAQLQQLFGDPMKTDNYKVSTEWVFFTGLADRMVVTLYDYKETNLYSKELPTVEQFRVLPSYEWHVGAKSKLDAARFIAWLKWKLLSMTTETDSAVIVG